MSTLLKKTLLLLLAVYTLSAAQYAAFYPMEIFFTPIGFQNRIVGDTDKESYTTFSALRVALNKDIPSPSFMSNKFIFNGSVEQYHKIGKQRNYFPLFLNPVLKSHFFISDVVTLGVEFNGGLESLYGLKEPVMETKQDVLINDLFENDTATALSYKPVTMIYDRRGRIIPFFYIALTPDLLIYNAFTYGRSSYSKAVFSSRASGLVM